VGVADEVRAADLELISQPRQEILDRHRFGRERRPRIGAEPGEGARHQLVGAGLAEPNQHDPEAEARAHRLGESMEHAIEIELGIDLADVLEDLVQLLGALAVLFELVEVEPAEPLLGAGQLGDLLR
jgi:hypothetical protein